MLFSLYLTFRWLCTPLVVFHSGNSLFAFALCSFSQLSLRSLSANNWQMMSVEASEIRKKSFMWRNPEKAVAPHMQPLHLPQPVAAPLHT